MGRIVRRPRAQRDLDELWDTIADDKGQQTADRFLRKIYRRLSALANSPLGARNRSDIRPGLRGSPVGRYVIFYYPLQDGIVVTRVLYGGRDIPTIYDEDNGDEELGTP